MTKKEYIVTKKNELTNKYENVKVMAFNEKDAKEKSNVIYPWSIIWAYKNPVVKPYAEVEYKIKLKQEKKEKKKKSK